MFSNNNPSGLLDGVTNGGLAAYKPVKTNVEDTPVTTSKDSSRIPTPPPVPKMEYLLSKLSKSKQIQINNLIGAESLLSSSDGNDSDTASVGSSHSRSSGGSLRKKKKKREGGSSSPVQRRQNKPGLSPPLPRRARVRKLTPMVKVDGMRHPVPTPKRLFYDEPLPIGQISPRHSSPSPTVSPFSSGSSSRNTTPSSSFREELTRPSRMTNESSSPYDFMKAFNTAMATTSDQPKVMRNQPRKFMRQNGVNKSEEIEEDGSISPTLLEIDKEIQAMQKMVEGDIHISDEPFISSVKVTEEYEDDDDLSDDDSSSTETSSEEEIDEFIQLNMTKPHLQTGATNIHAPKRRLTPIAINGGMKGGIINRGRLVQKRQAYRPRLYARRRFCRLETIVEETEERFHTGV